MEANSSGSTTVSSRAASLSGVARENASSNGRTRARATSKEAAAAGGTRLGARPDDQERLQVRQVVGDLRQHLVGNDGELRLRPAQRPFDLRCLQVVVDGHRDARRAGYPQISDDPLQPVLADDAHLVAAIQPHGEERRPEGARLLPELAVGEPLELPTGLDLKGGLSLKAARGLIEYERDSQLHDLHLSDTDNLARFYKVGLV